MRRTIMVLLAVLVCVVAFGFYRGWFTVSSPGADKKNNKVDVNLTVDRAKIEKDAETVKKKATEITGKVTEEANKLGDRVNGSK